MFAVNSMNRLLFGNKMQCVCVCVCVCVLVATTVWTSDEWTFVQYDRVVTPGRKSNVRNVNTLYISEKAEFPIPSHCKFDLFAASAGYYIGRSISSRGSHYLLSEDKALLGNTMLQSRVRGRELTVFCYITSHRGWVVITAAATDVEHNTASCSSWDG